MRAAVWTAAVLPVPAFAAGLNLLSLWTLVGEIITFAILVWVVMKYVWPPLMNAVEERRRRKSPRGWRRASRGARIWMPPKSARTS